MCTCVHVHYVYRYNIGASEFTSVFLETTLHIQTRSHDHRSDIIMSDIVRSHVNRLLSRTSTIDINTNIGYTISMLVPERPSTVLTG